MSITRLSKLTLGSFAICVLTLCDISPVELRAQDAAVDDVATSSDDSAESESDAKVEDEHIPKGKKAKANSKEKSAAQEEPDTSPARPEFWATRSMEMQFGLNFNAGTNYCTALHATVPFPMSWPEQEVELISFDMPEFARYTMRQQKSRAVEAVIDMDRMSPNDSFDVVGKVRIKKSFIKPPQDVSILKFPSNIKSKELSQYLGDSPYIETKTRQIRIIASEIRDRGHENPWKHVEAIYDYVRDKIRYEGGEIRSSTEALKDGTGDCEEMTSVFIAICRASNIPARCVWIPDHCYPEFYLEVDKDKGYWYPCQVAGDRQFGEMNEYRPILQKGDRFKTPEKKEQVRYLAETFTCKVRSTMAAGGTQPFIRQIQDLGPLSEELKGLKDGASQSASNSKGDSEADTPAPNKD